MENDDWTYGPQQNILALDQPPVLPAETRKYCEKHRDRTKAGKKREKQTIEEKRRIQNAHAKPMQNKKNQDEQEAPCYRMSRDIETVPDLWREWTRGIDGAEPVRELVRKWGTRWRETSQTENSFFCRRKVILDAIIQSQDSDQMVVDLEARRHME